MPAKKAPQFTLSTIKEAPQAKSKIERGPFASKGYRTSPQKKGSPMKKVSPEKAPAGEKKPLSKYMRECLRLQFVDLIHSYDIYQAKKRAAALTTTRKHLAGRFMKLFRAFRHKKFGEEDPFAEKEVEYPEHLKRY